MYLKLADARILFGHKSRLNHGFFRHEIYVLDEIQSLSFKQTGSVVFAWKSRYNQYILTKFRVYNIRRIG